MQVFRARISPNLGFGFCGSFPLYNGPQHHHRARHRSLRILSTGRFGFSEQLAHDRWDALVGFGGAALYGSLVRNVISI